MYKWKIWRDLYKLTEMVYDKFFLFDLFKFTGGYEYSPYHHYIYSLDEEEIATMKFPIEKSL